MGMKARPLPRILLTVRPTNRSAPVYWPRDAHGWPIFCGIKINRGNPCGWSLYYETADSLAGSTPAKRLEEMKILFEDDYELNERDEPIDWMFDEIVLTPKNLAIIEEINQSR